ncbi:hypothetical protein OU995_12620 [Roseateles sp. SL47]|uniref:hypothetical protein n=1 Tax=Roseateles sp. SL47 TaxID=2995138 RepID=UPI00226EFE9A|nr:hypothetical protein [Roseateles sp. SL47]WAC75488.1 hypothetical protein OU995_12620 [Roseateles sp. SL47]
MGLFNRLQSAQPHGSGAGTTASERASCGSAHRALALPPDTPPADRLIWESMKKPAEWLLQDINGGDQMMAAYPIEKQIEHGAHLPVNPRTLLDGAPTHSRGRQIRHRLHANQVSPDTVVMATPRYVETALWKKSATDKGISHVVRIGTRAEEMALDLAVLEAGPSLPAEGEPQASDPASARQWQVDVAPGSVMSPRQIMEVCEQLAARPPQATCLVAFQSPEGDDRSAMFAAGWMLYRRMAAAERGDRALLNHDDIVNLVHEVVFAIRFNRSSRLLSQPEQLMTLLALGQMLRGKDLSNPAPLPAREPGRGITRGITRVAPVAPQVPNGSIGPIGPVPSVSTPAKLATAATAPPATAAKPADAPADPKRRQAARRAAPHPDRTPHAAAARAFCKAMVASLEASAGDFAPIKGGKGLERIRIGQALAQHPQLKGRDGTRLHGAWAADRTLVLERPHAGQSLAWAAACLQHNIGAVLDVSGADERDHPNAMPNGTKFPGTATSVTFQWQAPPRPLTGLAVPAHATGMNVSCHVDGQDLLRDISKEPPFMDPKDIDARVRPLELIDMPLTPHQPVDPATLLVIAETVQLYRTDGTHDAVAVQCPPGDMRGALIAAADLLYTQRCQGQVDAGTLVETAKALWQQLCTQYSLDLADHPEHLESLIAMGDLALKSDRKMTSW